MSSHSYWITGTLSRHINPHDLVPPDQSSSRCRFKAVLNQTETKSSEDLEPRFPWGTGRWPVDSLRISTKATVSITGNDRQITEAVGHTAAFVVAFNSLVPKAEWAYAFVFDPIGGHIVRVEPGVYAYTNSILLHDDGHRCFNSAFFVFHPVGDGDRFMGCRLLITASPWSSPTHACIRGHQPRVPQ